MVMVLQRFITLLLILLPFVSLSQSISVQVSLEDQPMDLEASILLLEKSKGDLVKYDVASDTSDCIFKGVSPGHYELNVRYFGYSDTSVTFRIERDDKLSFSFILKPLSYNLPGVSIIDKIIGLKKKGDTTQYNLKAYKTGNERTIGDVLNVLPGIDVDSDGNVHVGNKKVDALLIERKEIVNGQHKLATEGLDAEVVKSVEVIENYRRRKAQFVDKQRSDQVAVNIILNDGAKNVWKGNIALFAGYKNRIKSELSLFQVSEKAGWSIFLRQNNIGEKPVAKPISIVLEDLLQENEDRPVKSLAAARSEFNSLLTPEKNVFSNRDYHLSINGDREFGNRLRNQLFVTATHSSLLTSRFSQRDYLSLNVSENMEETTDQQQTSGYLRNRTTINWNKKHFSQVIIKTNALARERNGLQIGNFNQNDLNQEDNLSSWGFNIKPQFAHISKLSKKWTLELNSGYNFRVKEGETYYSSKAPFMELRPTSEGNFILRQNTDKHHRRWSNSLEATNNLKNGFLRFKLESNMERSVIDASVSHLLPFLADGRQTVRTNVFLPSIIYNRNLSHSRNKFNYSVRLSYATIEQELFEQKSNHIRTFLPKLFLLYKFHKSHALSVSYSRNLSYYGIDRFTQIGQVISPQQVVVGSATINGYQESDDINFSLFQRDYGARFYYHLSLKKSFLEPDIVYQNSINSDYNLSSIVQTGGSELFSSDLTTKYKLKLFEIKLTSEIRLQDRYVISQGEQFSSKHTIIGNQLSIGISKIKNVQLNLSLGHNLSNFDALGRNSRYSEYQIGFNVDWTYKQWNIEMEGTQEYQSSNSVDNSLSILSCELENRLSKKWAIYIDANNVLNLNSNETLSNVFNEQFTQINVVQQNPGQILIGARYSF